MLEHFEIEKKKVEFALKGADSELGCHIANFKNFGLYVGAGPYYLNGRFHDHSFGGKARIHARIFPYAFLEGTASYDSIFGEIFQGQMGIAIPFGKKSKTKSTVLCSNLDSGLGTRWVTPVQRREIIPVDRHKMTINSGLITSAAIDPSTGDPYYFIFVDNTSSSNGSFEHPFPTLVEAQDASAEPGNVIYVFPGDGTSTGMDQGIVLKDGQKLLGTGLSHTFATTLGPVIVPPLATGMPLITQNSITLPAISCANNNEIAGLHISQPALEQAAEISCLGSFNVFIHDNIVDMDFGGFFTDLLALIGCSGQITITDNSFGFTTGTGTNNNIVHLHASNPTADYLFERNQFGNDFVAGATGFRFGSMSADNYPLPILLSLHSLTISNNTFTNLGGPVIGVPIGGYGFDGAGQTVLDQNIFNFSNVGAGDTIAGFGGEFAAVNFNFSPVSNQNLLVTNNIWENSQPANNPPPTIFPSLEVKPATAEATLCLTLTGNTSDVANPDTAYLIDNSLGGAFTADINNNVGPIQTLGTVVPGSCP